MKKSYFFGYLFVRGAKIFALIVISAGVGFCVLQYSQANTAVSAVAYQPSTSLQRALGNLKDAFSATEQIVGAFNADNQIATPKVQPPRFPTIIESNADFAHEVSSVQAGEGISCEIRHKKNRQACQRDHNQRA